MARGEKVAVDRDLEPFARGDLRERLERGLIRPIAIGIGAARRHAHLDIGVAQINARHPNLLRRSLNQARLQAHFGIGLSGIAGAPANRGE